MAKFRGLKEKNEQDPQLLLRDTRPLGRRIIDFLGDPTSATVILVALAVACFVATSLIDLVVFLGICLFAFAMTRKNTLPFRLPIHANTLDYNDTIPGTNKPLKARGICFLGNEKDTNEEIWFTNDDMRTHILIFGSTGSGKTEALISFCFNALIQSSGFIYVDGKGDNSLYSKIFSMARKMGREDDLLLINFMTGAKDIVGPQEKRLSNTLNPFANGSSSMLSQLVISLMDSSSQSSDGDMWKGRAIVFVEALMKVLVYARDQGYVLLDANSIRNYFHLDRLETIVIDKVLPRDKQEPMSLHEAPEVVLEPLNNYVTNLPGYDKSKKGKQVSQVLEQHGFITMQLTRAFGSMADTYGHILRTNLAEVDLKDVVLNRRILIVLLPALEKSPEELSNLGKVIIATLKAMMASGLGEAVEGDYSDVILSKPTNARTPFMCVLDEYGYYAVPGFAVVPAQARSLGFSVIFAGQDLPAFQKASKEEAASIGANTNIKICMKLEDPTETWEFFSKTAGEAFVTKVDAFQTNANSLTNMYMDTRSSSTEKRARVDLLDLKEQDVGEAHIFFKSKIVRARAFYANPPPVDRIRINHFLKVEIPPTKKLVQLEQRHARFMEVMQGDEPMAVPDLDGDEELSQIVEALKSNEFLGPIERGVSALLAFHNREVPEDEDDEVDETPIDELNIYVPLRQQDLIKDLVITDDFESFSQPLLHRATAKDNIEHMERLTGKTSKHAMNITNEIMKDVSLATHYPPEVVDQVSAEELSSMVGQLIDNLQELKNTETSDDVE